MTDKILTLTVSSPEELRAHLLAARKDSKKKFEYVSIAISGPQILVRPFALSNVSRKEVKNGLKFDAVELLSMPLSDIELHYQIFNASAEATNGIFICLPKKLLKTYLEVAYKEKFIPLQIKPYMVAVLDAFFLKNEIKDKHFVLLDFSRPQMIHLSIYQNNKCASLREIPYENTQEAKGEIVQTLRSACGKSHTKEWGNIYMLGETLAKNEFMADLEQNFSIKPKQMSAVDVTPGLSVERTYFRFNLIRRYSMSLSERKFIMHLTNVLIALGVFFCLTTVSAIRIAYHAKEDMKKTYTQMDFDNAKKLQKQVQSLSRP